MSNETATAKHNLVPHPTALQTPDAVRCLEKSTAMRVVLIDGMPVLVSQDNASKHLPTGG